MAAGAGGVSGDDGAREGVIEWGVQVVALKKTGESSLCGGVGGVGWRKMRMVWSRRGVGVEVACDVVGGSEWDVCVEGGVKE